MPPLLATGFRPFFLLAAVFAAVALPAWVLALGGHLPAVQVVWHAHEMLLGFAMAVLAGFLLTAVRNWTGRATASGALLAGLVALWGAGRIGAWLWHPLLVWADVVFAAALAAVIAVPLVGARSTRNAAFPLLLLGVGAADAALHAGLLDLRAATTWILDAVIVVMGIVGGRIVPLFTSNAIPGSATRNARLDAAALGTLGVLLAADAVAPGTRAAGVAAALAGLANLARMIPWGSVRTGRAPILWVLHLGYLWIGVGLALRGLASFGLAPWSLGVHVLTVGAIGTLTLGMMSRVALGHTGRPLHVSRLIVAAYLAVTAALLARAAAALGAPAGVLHASGWAFALAFAAYCAVYLPILAGPRADGKPG